MSHFPDEFEKLLEALGALEHEQWMHWSKTIAAEVPPATREKWAASWIPYAQLPEDLKEADRVWARKVVALLREKKFPSV